MKKLTLKKARIELRDLLEYLALEVGRTLDRQGHRLTGKLIRSLKPKLDTGAVLTGSVLWESYGEAINKGISARRIPYSPGSGAASSQYIQGLLRYVQKRRMRPKAGQTQLGIAFAIARRHKAEGMPTKASRRFSKTGKRTQAVERTLAQEKKNIETGVSDVVEALILELIDTIITAIIRSKKFVIIS